MPRPASGLIRATSTVHIAVPYKVLRRAHAVIAGTKPCDLKLEGADKLLKDLPGGLDGTYAVWSCENGRPLYKRRDSPVAREPPQHTCIPAGTRKKAHGTCYLHASPMPGVILHNHYKLWRVPHCGSTQGGCVQ